MRQEQNGTAKSIFEKKQKTKHIKTKKIAQLERLDRLSWWIPLAVYLLLYHRNPLAIFLTFSEGIAVGIYTILLTFAMLSIIYLPLMLLWRTVSYTLKKEAIKQTTFSVLDDFDYWRDVLTGISPATISMCVDFELERDKDLAATLLKLTMQGLVETDGTTVRVLCEVPPADCTESERYLLCTLAGGTLPESAVAHWAILARDEVLRGPYLKVKHPPKTKGTTDGSNATKKEKATGCLGCLPFFLVIGLSGWLLESDPVAKMLALPEGLSNAEFFAMFAQDSDYLLGVLIVLGLGALLFVSITLPFSGVIWGVLLGRSRSKTQYQRTAEGASLTEQLYGLKNFLHDFSDLAHAEKEALVLWDDFLVYAVVLEENDAIVSEITAMRNMTLITPEALR